MNNRNFRIFKYILSLAVVSIFFNGCASDKAGIEVTRVTYDKDSKEPMVVFLLDSKDPESNNYNNQIRKTVNYTKIPYQQIDVSDFNNDTSLPETSKVVVVKDSKALNNKAIESLISFVVKGNTLVFTNTSDDAKFGFLAGVKRNSNYETDVTSYSYVFKKELIPNLKNGEYDNDINHYGLKSKNFLPTIEVLATAVNDPEYPSIIKHKIGNGQVISFNSTQYSQKKDRGLYFSVILSGLEAVPYPVANVGAIFLDDFPSPLYQSQLEPIKTEFSQSQQDFYQENWWPDMQRLARQTGISYTAIPAFDYRGKTEPPFLFPEWDNALININGKKLIASDVLMKSVISSGHEIGFHGYNHQSLTIQDWPDQEVMEISLSSAIKKWKSSGFGSLPVTYVPPSNIIDPTGIDALSVAIPSLKVMSSLYFGDFEEGAAREFDPEPYNDNFYDFPRVTSGYVINQNGIYAHQSTFLYTGIWTHFIHPDDAYQIPENDGIGSKGDYDYRNKFKLGWQQTVDGKNGLFPTFSKYLTDTKKQYPLLSIVTAKEAAQKTQQWRESKFNFDIKNQNITVSGNSKTEQTWMVYVSQKNIAPIEDQLTVKGFKYSRTPFLDGYLYTFQTPKPEVQLDLSGNYQSGLAPAGIDYLNKFEEYSSGRMVFETIDEEIAYYVSNGELDKAVDRLEYKISSSDSYLEEDWMALKTYLGWSGREFAIWPFLERRFQQTKDDQLISLSRKLTQNSDYPYLYIRKTWMERQMRLYPNDAVLKKQYNDYFLEQRRQELTPEKAILALAVTDDPDEKRVLLNYLVDYDPAKAKLYLSKTTSCEDEDLQPLANSIAWSYAQDQKYTEAIAWAKCSDLNAEVVKEWRILNGEFEFLKETDYPAYIQYLLANNPQRAVQELLYKTPCEDEELHGASADIAYAFSIIGAYRKALDWSQCSDTVPMIDRMQWLFELRDYQQLEKELLVLINDQPENVPFLKLMVQTQLAQNNIIKAYEYQRRLPLKEQQLEQQRWNEIVTYATVEQKKVFLERYGNSLNPAVKSKLVKDLRIQKGTTLETFSNLVTDRFSPTQLNNRFLYGQRAKNGSRHQFGLTQTTAYAIPVRQDDPANRDFNLYGARYAYTSPERTKKVNYNGGITVEMDTNDNQLFYKLDAAASLAIDSLYNSLQLSYEPAITGPAYALNIYRAQATVYEELQLKNNLNIVATLEGNYYTDGAVDGLVLAKVGYNLKLATNSTLIPFVEGSGMLGNRDQREGFPYWTIKERLYGGGGLNYRYKNLPSKLEAQINTGAFLDTFSGSFLRYGGSLSYPVSDYFIINANAEFFTIKNFYSNNFILGLKYYLK